MEAARTGDMTALRSALDGLYLKRTDLYADPQIAFELYKRVKQANPKDTIEGEVEITELLRMATALGPFDMRPFLKW